MKYPEDIMSSSKRLVELNPFIFELYRMPYVHVPHPSPNLLQETNMEHNKV